MEGEEAEMEEGYESEAQRTLTRRCVYELQKRVLEPGREGNRADKDSRRRGRDVGECRAKDVDETNRSRDGEEKSHRRKTEAKEYRL